MCYHVFQRASLPHIVHTWKNGLAWLICAKITSSTLFDRQNSPFMFTWKRIETCLFWVAKVPA